MIDPGETRDDGNGEPGDGCGLDCATECGFSCIEAGGSCIPASLATPSGEILDGPTVLTENGDPVAVWSILDLSAPPTLNEALLSPDPDPDQQRDRPRRVFEAPAPVSA